LPLDPKLLWLSTPEVELYLMEEKLRMKKDEKSKKKTEPKTKKRKKKASISSDDDSDSLSDEAPPLKQVKVEESVSDDVAVEDDDEFGPAPLQQKEITERGYGKALLPGEGSAIASFVQAGQRIPRRGEVGLPTDMIEKYEDLGYVMSGSRNHRMNAIRIRKENQVIAAEEARAMALLQVEEKVKKEQKLIADLRKIVDGGGK
jgi:hypothetical protein